MACEDTSGLSWAYCMALDAGASSRDAVLGTVETVATGAQSTLGGAVKGAQQVGGKLADAVKDAGPDVKLDAGAVVAIAAIGLGAVAVADAYFTSGQGARSIRRALTGR